MNSHAATFSLVSLSIETAFLIFPVGHPEIIILPAIVYEIRRKLFQALDFSVSPILISLDSFAIFDTQCFPWTRH
jgi:hypothetical protein